MGLRHAYTGVRVLETVQNYVKADEPLTARWAPQGVSDLEHYLDDDQRFWKSIIGHPSGIQWGVTIRFPVAILSEWVARVPGLYWKDGSDALRQVNPATIEKTSNDWVQYAPPSKSQRVMGGIGTILLPPSSDGRRLISLTTSCNASAGIPALVTADVYDKIRRSGTVEGRIVNGRGKWEPIGASWATQFPSTRSIPRGYVVLDNPDQIEVSLSALTEIHPFSIMEYRDGSKLLYDFVYATADTAIPNYRVQLEDFFDAYKDERGRSGHYIVAGDMVNPMWDSDFESPAELRRRGLSFRSRLALLEQRVRERMMDRSISEELLQALGKTCSVVDDLLGLSREVNIEPQFWNVDGPLAEKIHQFVAEAAESRKLDQVLEATVLRYPSVLDR
jgi:hypothetical protein